MTKHYNPSLVERFNRIFRTKAGDQFGDEVSGPVAVINVEPVSRIVKNGVLTNATSSTIFTTAADKDTYIVAVSLGYIKDATATATRFNIQCTVDGVAVAMLSLPGITLTAASGSNAVSFPYPIKVDRGTAVSLTSDTAVANFKTAGTVIGYTEEVTAT